MKYRFLLISTIPFFLSSCASLNGSSNYYSESNNNQLAINKTQSSNKNLPIYDLLIAELSVRRGDNQTAVDHYLDAIDKVDSAEIAERAVRIAAHANDFEAAQTAVKKWQLSDPDNYKPYQISGTLFLRQGFVNDSIEQYKKSIELRDASSRLAFSSILQILARERSATGILTVSKNLADDYPKNAYAQFMHGSLAAKYNQSQEAINYINQALAIEDIEDAHGLKAQLLLKTGQRTEAVKSLSIAVKNHPNNNEMRLTYARLLIDTKQYKQARIEFSKLLKKSPNDADLLYTLGLLSLESNLLDDAETHLSKLLQSRKRRPEATYYLGRINESKKDFNQAIAWYLKVDSGDFKFDAQIRAAKLQASIGKSDDATKTLNELKLTHPNQATLVRIYLAEAAIYRNNQQYQKAIDIYNEALAQIPGNNDLLYARAITSEKVGRLDVLEEDILQILKTEPDNAHALNALGFSLTVNTTRYEDAKKYIQRALELAPGEAAIIDSMGWVEFKLGNIEIAEKHLRKAYSILADAEIAAHLSEVLWTLGKRNEARSIWNSVLKDEPENSYIKEVIQRLDP